MARPNKPVPRNEPMRQYLANILRILDTSPWKIYKKRLSEGADEKKTVSHSTLNDAVNGFTLPDDTTLIAIARAIYPDLKEARSQDLIDDREWLPEWETEELLRQELSEIAREIRTGLIGTNRRAPKAKPAKISPKRIASWLSSKLPLLDELEQIEAFSEISAVLARTSSKLAKVPAIVEEEDLKEKEQDLSPLIEAVRSDMEANSCKSVAAYANFVTDELEIPRKSSDNFFFEAGLKILLEEEKLPDPAEQGREYTVLFRRLAKYLFNGKFDGNPKSLFEHFSLCAEVPAET